MFKACAARIAQLLPACPERRDLVHGDLLHQNVLVTDDASAVTAIFSWKCSIRGDFLYDVAWCTFWGAWHPGIAAADLWKRTLAAPDLVAADLVDAAWRHHCYELQIAATHLGWNTWTGNHQELMAVADAAERVLERGPLPMQRS
jgi:aminoglycoside phosphotransferase (APT) family kinase protein